MERGKHLPIFSRCLIVQQKKEKLCTPKVLTNRYRGSIKRERHHIKKNFHFVHYIRKLKQQLFFFFKFSFEKLAVCCAHTGKRFKFI